MVEGRDEAHRERMLTLCLARQPDMDEESKAELTQVQLSVVRDLLLTLRVVSWRVRELFMSFGSFVIFVRVFMAQMMQMNPKEFVEFVHSNAKFERDWKKHWESGDKKDSTAHDRLQVRSRSIDSKVFQCFLQGGLGLIRGRIWPRRACGAMSC